MRTWQVVQICHEYVANVLPILCGPDVGEELDDGEVVVSGGLVVEGVAGPAAGRHQQLPVLPRHVVLPHQHLHITSACPELPEV